MDRFKILSVFAIFLCTLSQAQQVSIDTEVTAPFFSVVRDLRKLNICVDESLGSKGIIVMRDDTLPLQKVAIADGTFLEDIILIRYNQHLINMPFKEQKFVLLHELLHHKKYFHWDRVLGMQAYSKEIPDYYEIALHEAAILFAE